MSDKPVFVYVATYNNVNDAQSDYQAAKVLHQNGVIGTYDAAVINKDASGKVHISKTETATKKGAWTGAAVGAVVGLVFPPSIIVGAAVGAGAGALAGHLAKGMPSSDLKQIGTMLNSSTAAIIVMGESELKQKLQKTITKAVQQAEYQAQVDPKEFDKDFDQLVNQLASGDTTGTSASPNP